MPDGGNIEISGKNILINDKSSLPLDDGNYIKISIKDNGVGIPKTNFLNIFDPYFTTKENHKGLGLSTTYSIIKNYKGYFNFESEVGIGTTFHIYLPAISSLKSECEKLVKKIIKILLMDDEEVIRDSIGQLLEKHGYKVGYAPNGSKAIELYKKAMEQNDAFQIVILDLIIPQGKDGKQTIDELLIINPKVKAIASSGYTNDPLILEYKKHGFSAVASKPYKIAELKDIINKLL